MDTCAEVLLICEILSCFEKVLEINKFLLVKLVLKCLGVKCGTIGTILFSLFIFKLNVIF